MVPCSDLSGISLLQDLSVPLFRALQMYNRGCVLLCSQTLLTMEPFKNGACCSTSFHEIHFGKCYSLGLCVRLCKTLHPIKQDRQLPPHWKRAPSSARDCASWDFIPTEDWYLSVCRFRGSIALLLSHTRKPCLLLIFLPNHGWGDLVSILITCARVSRMKHFWGW